MKPSTYKRCHKRLAIIHFVEKAYIVAYVWKPFLASRSDVSKPIPVELPVTIAVFPSANFLCFILLLLSLVSAFGIAGVNVRQPLEKVLTLMQ
jgi:hypothetical protein